MSALKKRGIYKEKENRCWGDNPRLFKESVQFSSVAQSCPTLCDPVNRSMPGLPIITNSQSSLRLTSIESVIPSSHLIICGPLLLLPPIPPSSPQPTPLDWYRALVWVSWAIRWKLQSFNNWFQKWYNHYFCCILFVINRSKSLSLGHIQGEEIRLLFFKWRVPKKIVNISLKWPQVTGILRFLGVCL